MPRALTVGNGNLLINIGDDAFVRDFYFPHVGMEDHTGFDHFHRIGVYDEYNKQFSWLNDGHWRSHATYVDETLVGNIVLESDKLGLRLTFNDYVEPTKNIFFRKVTAENLWDKGRHIRLFFNYDFHLYGNKANDTVYYDVNLNALVFYKYNRYMLMNAEKEDGKGISQYTTGKAEYKDLIGTWKDAEDGKLSGHPIEQGSTDTTFGVDIDLEPKSKFTTYTWVCAGEDLDEVHELNAHIKEKGIDKICTDTQNYWEKWVNKQDFNFEGVPPEMIKLFKRSLLIVRTQIDNGGAILAANDSDIMKFNKDTYTYMWPRDGGLIALALDDAGYSEVTTRFFEFCAEIQTDDGYMLHKYNPDGSIGSSWHPAIYKGQAQNPLQEDETAIPLIAIWNHYTHYRDIEFLHEMYREYVEKAANFMCNYRDKRTGLPKASYDLWEEQKGVFTFTTAAVYGALMAAHKISKTLGHETHCDRYKKNAEEIKESALKYLYSDEHKRFLKKVYLHDHDIEKDTTIDASICGVFMFGMLDADDPKVVSTMEQMTPVLKVDTHIGGYARYEKDYYHRVGEYTPEVPGNPWVITSLWIAQWNLQVAEDTEDEHYKKAMDILWWVVHRANPAGLLAEQYDPFTGAPMSVSPLTWSHSTFVDTIMLLRSKLTEFGVCEECMVPNYLISKK